MSHHPTSPTAPLRQALAPGLFALALLSATATTAAGPVEVTPDAVVSAIEATFGVTPGHRRNHTKGTCAAGHFIATPEAANYSRSALFGGARIPVIARFSLAGGNPATPDTARNPRGMALNFRLPGGGLQNMAMLNTPVFGAADPAGFLAHIRAIRRDPATSKPDPAAIQAFKAAHPEAVAQGRYLATHNPPRSYANSAYFGIHAFRLLDAGDRTTLVRWRFLPGDGEASLSDKELASAPRDFLEQRLIERAQQGPFEWEMWAAIGEPGDPITDPTRAWPAERQQVHLGTLTLTSATPQAGAACEGINYDPLVMADGIAPTDDPILHFRSPAYAISFVKRLSE